MGKNQHVVSRDKGWAVRAEGAGRDSVRTSTQKEAIAHARSAAIAQRSEVVIHNREGQFRDRNSYGNDPPRRRG